MPGFQGPEEYEILRGYITHTQRHFIDIPDLTDFLAALDESAKKRASIVKSGTHWWRAQIGGSGADFLVRLPTAPHPPERMLPPVVFQAEGRANPRGITALYLATDLETAISEVRPSTSHLVTAGRFTTDQELRLIDCSGSRRRDRKWNWEDPDDLDNWVWASINEDFLAPILPDDPFVDYAITQILAQRFRARGFDGVIYDSALTQSGGKNIALFGTENVALDTSSLKLHRVTKVIVVSDCVTGDATS